MSYSSQDKDVVREIARRLAEDGLGIWFDEWVIEPGDNIPAAIESGMQDSRIILLCLSQSALKSDWATLERQTAIFRDPSNKHHRFIPLRLDDSPLPDTIQSFRAIDWHRNGADKAYEQLRSVCRERAIPPPSEVTYHHVFTPGAPPTRRDLLVGRDEAVEALVGYLLSPGIHPIVVGPRGIGKTSLVHLAISQHRYEYASRLEANTVTNFDQCCRQICADLEIEPSLGEFSPASFLRVLIDSSRSAVIAIDELDDVPKRSDIPIKLAKFAKAASNQSDQLRPKFVFSGIGVDAHNLFRGHLSSSRNHPVIYLNPINDADLVRFLDVASTILEIEIPRQISEEMVGEADGFPYYVHQVGYHAFACLDRDSTSRQLQWVHYEEGKRRASDSAFAHYLRQYKFTLYRLSSVQKYILSHLVLSKKRHHDYDDFESTVQSGCSLHLDEIKGAFRQLTDKGYIQFRKADRTISLHDPLVKPFLRAKLRIEDDDAQMRLF